MAVFGNSFSYNKTRIRSYCTRISLNPVISVFMNIDEFGENIRGRTFKFDWDRGVLLKLQSMDGKDF